MSKLSLSVLAAMLVAGASAPASAALLLNTNLVANGGAEGGSPGTSIPSFTAVAGGAMEVVAYGPGGFPTASDPGPSNRGRNFFSGGLAALSSITQTVSVADGATAIDAGSITFVLDAYLGGFTTQNDNASFSVAFLDGGGTTINSTTLTGPGASGRGGVTGLFERTATGTVAVGTRSLLFTLTATRTDGSYNDGYADNLSFVAAGTAPPPTGVPEPVSLAMLGIGLVGLASARRRA